MPVILGYTAAKKFHLNPMVGLVIGAALCYPTVQGAALQSGFLMAVLRLIACWVFRLMKHFWVSHGWAAVIPVASYLLSSLSHLPDKSKNCQEMDSCSRPDLLVPFSVLLIALPAGFLIIGPIVSILTDLLSTGFQALMDFFSSCVWCSSRVSLASTGDFRTSLEYYPSCDYAASAKWVESDVSRRLWREFCTDSSGIGDVFQVQGSKMKALCMPAVISGIFGVTEPAIYGITYRRRSHLFTR